MAKAKLAREKSPKPLMMPPWEALEKAIKATCKPPEPPPTAFTLTQLMARMKCGRSKATKLIKTLKECGAIRVLPFNAGGATIYYEYTGLEGRCLRPEDIKEKS